MSVLAIIGLMLLSLGAGGILVYAKNLQEDNARLREQNGELLDAVGEFGEFVTKFGTVVDGPHFLDDEPCDDPDCEACTGLNQNFELN